MRKYYSNYQESHDIDWFFRYKRRLFHITSNGGKIPNGIDSKTNRMIQHLLETEQKKTSHIRIADNPDNLDYSTFYEYAEKGFISIDRVDGLFEEQIYFVVAIPSTPCLPSSSIIDLIPEINPFSVGMTIIDIDRIIEE